MPALPPPPQGRQYMRLLPYGRMRKRGKHAAICPHCRLLSCIQRLKGGPQSSPICWRREAGHTQRATCKMLTCVSDGAELRAARPTVTPTHCIFFSRRRSLYPPRGRGHAHPFPPPFPEFGSRSLTLMATFHTLYGASLHGYGSDDFASALPRRLSAQSEALSLTVEQMLRHTEIYVQL